MNLQPTLLENDVVRIIPVKESDLERLFVVASDPLIWEQHPSKDRYRKEVFELYFDSAVTSKSAFLILDKATNALIGCTRFYDYEPERSSVAIGYTFLARKFWGGSYNRSVKKLLLDYAFQFVKSVKFHVGVTNIRSQKAILKLGARKINEVNLTDNKQALLHFEYEITMDDWRMQPPEKAL